MTKQNTLTDLGFFTNIL
jgi:outer membrane biosynthesis protein TonB